MERDNKMLKLIKDNMPTDRKVKILELGSGRGGLSRHVAKNLIAEDKLEYLLAQNISETENDYNRKKGLDEGLSADKFKVEYGTFDNMSFGPESFDVIFSNEAILHSADKAVLMQNIAKILSKGGICVISDIIEAPNVDKSKLAEVYRRLDLPSMGNHELYDKELTGSGLTKVLKEVSSDPIINHYGMVLYSVTELKREELLGPDGVTKEFLDQQASGLHKWVENGIEGLVQQGWFVYKK